MPKLDRFRLANARRLRSDMTDAEVILWHHLWRIPTEGTHFRRQVPLGPYIVDFLSHRLKLVIELDGAQHGFEKARRYDERRTRWLGREGYRVIRFWNHEVKRELEAVLDTIYRAVQEQCATQFETPTPALRADPPHRGEGKDRTDA